MCCVLLGGVTAGAGGAGGIWWGKRAELWNLGGEKGEIWGEKGESGEFSPRGPMGVVVQTPSGV